VVTRGRRRRENTKFGIGHLLLSSIELMEDGNVKQGDGFSLRGKFPFLFSLLLLLDLPRRLNHPLDLAHGGNDECAQNACFLSAFGKRKEIHNLARRK
jgi:hypothetical protein